MNKNKKCDQDQKFVRNRVHDLPKIAEDNTEMTKEEQGADILRSAVVSIHGLVALMLGGQLTADEDAILEEEDNSEEDMIIDSTIP